MISRNISNEIHNMLGQYPCIALMGPRQSGKTTLIKHICDHLPYISIENSNVQRLIKQDPYEFLNRYCNGAIFDEAQKAPELFSYLQQYIDDGNGNGRYILTGSHNFLLHKHITQSLAGRVALLTLLPLEYNEIAKIQTYSWQNIALRGGYPKLYNESIEYTKWYESYMRTYIEKDVRSLHTIKDIHQFQNFIHLCAGRAGHIMNLSSLGNDCGVDHKTIKSWLSILEASYIIHFVQPYHKNFNKRITKMPKLYFYDTGLLSYLLGIRKSEEIDIHFAKGHIFENLIFSEMVKIHHNKGIRPHIYFFREHNGHEIDFIIENGLQTYAIEAKAHTTPQYNFLKNITYFSKLFPDLTKGYVTYGSSKDLPASNQFIPWNQLRSVFDTII